MNKYRFTAEEINFMGADGFMVKQYHREDGQMATENFVCAAEYGRFCELVGVTPEIIHEQSTDADTRQILG